MSAFFELIRQSADELIIAAFVIALAVLIIVDYVVNIR